MYQQHIKEAEENFKKTVQFVKEELSKTRGGRASTAMVENIKVNYFGTPTLIKQLGAITVPDASTILIQPWDKNALADIENGIRNSDLNVSPTNDGINIRISLPPLSEERRDELIKAVKARAEEGKVGIRNHRQEFWQKIKDLERDKKITEDDRYRAEEELNKIVQNYNAQVDEIVLSKEEQLKNI